MKNILLKLCDGMKGQGEDSVRVRALSVGYYAQHAIAMRNHFSVALAGYVGILPTPRRSMLQRSTRSTS